MDPDRFSRNFPRYALYDSEVPIWCLTPHKGNVIHRFFDTSPLSPSGKFVALLRLPDREEFPRPGDRAEVVLIDTETGEERVVWETAGWEYQLGANINWGADDSQLLFNDVDTATWTPFAVVLDPISGASRKLERCVYHVSPDGRYALSADLRAMRRTQWGYGVMVPDQLVPEHFGPSPDDGVYLTDIATGKSRLLISAREAVERTMTAERRREYEASEVYNFHTKWSPDGTRLMFSLRFYPKTGGMFDAMSKLWRALRFDVFTIRPDGSELYNAIPASEWDKSGHHTNWTRDSRGLTMNLGIYRQGLRFCQCGYDGSNLRPIGEFTGSGHPSFHHNGRWGITDCYIQECFTAPDRSIPIRLIDLETNTERALTRVDITTPGLAKSYNFRLDPHPVWCDNDNFLIFNAMENGARRVFLADMRKFQ